MTKEIPLTQGKVAIVCDCHAHLVENDKWLAQRVRGKEMFYATRLTIHIFGKQRWIAMHRVINNTPSDRHTDHINGNTLDNRCCNLRTVTNSQNRMNQGRFSNNKSGFKGVHFDKCAGRWKSRISAGSVRINIGYFDNPEDAARAYDAKAKELFGEFAKLNFPD